MAFTVRGQHREVLAEAEGRLFAALGVEARSHRVELRDAPVSRARVLEAGAGPPVLLVHGAGFLGAVLEALDVDAVPVVGNSLGGAFGLYLAAAEPRRVPRLVLLGATGIALPGARGSLAMRLYSRPGLGRVLSSVSPPIRPRLVRRLLVSICGRRAVEAVPEPMLEVMAAAMRLSEPTTRTLMPELFSGGSTRAELALTAEELARIAAPARFAWGSRDWSRGPEAAERAVTAMPESSLVVLDAGHHPWWDDASRCAALIDEHLDASTGTRYVGE